MAQLLLGAGTPFYNKPNQKQQNGVSQVGQKYMQSTNAVWKNSSQSLEEWKTQMSTVFSEG